MHFYKAVNKPYSKTLLPFQFPAMTDKELDMLSKEMHVIIERPVKPAACTVIGADFVKRCITFKEVL